MLSFYHGKICISPKIFPFAHFEKKMGKFREKYIFPPKFTHDLPSASSALVNIGFLVEDYERIHNTSKVSKREGF